MPSFLRNRSSDESVRIHPWIALRAFAKVMKDPDDTASGARFVLALEGRNADRLFERFRAHPEGARMLAEGNRLRPILEDRERLRAMPAGSLGRAYLEFAETEQISVAGLAEATRDSSERFIVTTPERRLMSERITELHDLWHVVTGYSRDLVGEICLIAFSYVQLGTRAYRLLLPLGYLGMGHKVPGTRRLMREAWQRGKRAPWLLVVDWENLLEQPLAQVREQLHLGPPPVYTRYVRVDGKLVPEVAT